MAPAPIGGRGIESISDAIQLNDVTIEQLGSDVYVHGYANGEQHKAHSPDAHVS